MEKYALRITALTLLTLYALCFTAMQAGAVGKVTADPNVAAAQVTKSEPEKDKRLDQKVTYEARRKTVFTILSELTEMTGVKYNTGNNNLDWQVRDRKMNIFVKEIPLSSLMDSIARVMKFKWSKSEKDSVITYRLIEDKKALLDAQSKRQAKIEQARQRCIEGRQRMLEDLEAASKMSGDELEALKEKSPYVYREAKGWAKCLPQVFAEVPSAKDAWSRGDGFAVDFDSLSLGVKQTLSFAFRAESTSEGIIEISGFDDDIRDTFLPIGRYMVAVADNNAEGKKRIQSLSCSISDPGNNSANISARFFNNGSHGATEWVQYQKELNKIYESERIDMGESLAKHPEDPALCSKIKIKVEGDKSADVFAALAESSDFAVVSDSFEVRLWNITFPLETEVRAVLDKLEECRYNWEKHGSTLELHSMDWFRKRDTLMPEAKLEAWRKSFKKHGTLDIDELAQIAMLRPEQILANMFGDDVMANAFGAVACSRDLLRLYAGLDAQQKAMVFTAEGLNEKQGLNLDYIINCNNGPILGFGRENRWVLRAAAKEEPRLVGICEKQEKQTQYTFNIVTSSGEKIVEWKIKCPMYNSPKEKPEAVHPYVECS